MKRLNFVKKLAQSLHDTYTVEDIVNTELSNIALEMMWEDSDYEGFPFEEDARTFLEEKGLLKYLSDYQLGNIYDAYTDKRQEAQFYGW